MKKQLLKVSLNWRVFPFALSPKLRIHVGNWTEELSVISTLWVVLICSPPPSYSLMELRVAARTARQRRRHGSTLKKPISAPFSGAALFLSSRWHSRWIPQATFLGGLNGLNAPCKLALFTVNNSKSIRYSYCIVWICQKEIRSLVFAWRIRVRIWKYLRKYAKL